MPDPAPTAPVRKRPPWSWITIALCQVLQALSLLPWLAMAGLSVMAFDAPGSTERWEPWAFVLAIWSYPLWLAAAAVASWILFASGKPIFAVSIAAIFTLPPIVAGIVLFAVNA